jgi:hypothetical protein
VPPRLYRTHTHHFLDHITVWLVLTLVIGSQHDGSPIDLKAVPSLKVSVGHAVAELSQTPHEFTSWGDIQLHSKVTRGRVGGA